MSGVYVIDTECTDLHEPEVIELAYLKLQSVTDLAGASQRIPWPLCGDAPVVRRFKPAKPSKFGALAVHNILPEELEGCAPAAEAKLPEDCVYMIAHNADHDWRCLGAPEHVKRICTDAMARYVFPDADSYSQSALLYLTLGATPETRERVRGAHSAGQDVLNNLVLLGEILSETGIKTWPELYEYSEACRIPRVMPIGDKQGLKGLPLDEAYERDPGFIGWCLRQDWIDDYFRKGLEQAIERVESKRNAAPAAAYGSRS